MLGVEKFFEDGNNIVEQDSKEEVRKDCLEPEGEEIRVEELLINLSQIHRCDVSWYSG